MHSRAALSALFLTTILSAPAIAATPPEPTYGFRTPQAARASINREEAAKAKAQLAANAAAVQAYEAAKVAREDQIRRDQETYEADKVRLAAEHEAAMAKWQADVTACRTGDWSRCKH